MNTAQYNQYSKEHTSQGNWMGFIFIRSKNENNYTKRKLPHQKDAEFLEKFAILHWNAEIVKAYEHSERKISVSYLMWRYIEIRD